MKTTERTSVWNGNRLDMKIGHCASGHGSY